jgi:hypothetical protein
MNRRLEVRITVIDTTRSPKSYGWFKVRKSLWGLGEHDKPANSRMEFFMKKCDKSRGEQKYS